MAAYQTQVAVYTRAALDALLAATKARPLAALIAAGKVRLSTDPAFNPTPMSTIAGNAGSEAAFTGYPAGGIAWAPSDPLNLSPSVQGMVADALFVVGTPFVTGETITGYWLDDGTTVWFGEKFAGGVSFQMGSSGDFLELDLRLPLPNFAPAA